MLTSFGLAGLRSGVVNPPVLCAVHARLPIIDVLEHGSRDGTKVNALQNLERINALLDGFESNGFNLFIANVIEPLGVGLFNGRRYFSNVVR